MTLYADRFPFMADEAVEAAGLERVYTVKAYEVTPPDSKRESFLLTIYWSEFTQSSR